MGDIGHPYAKLPFAYISFTPGNPPTNVKGAGCKVALNGGVGLYRITLDRELAAQNYTAEVTIDSGANNPYAWSLLDTSNVFKDLKLSLNNVLGDPTTVTVAFRYLAQ